MLPTHDIGPGLPGRLGATCGRQWRQLALFAYHASEVHLLLFDRPDAARPSTVFRLDPETNRIASEPFNPEADHGHLFIMLNAYWEPLAFQVPELPTGRRWARLVDTAQPSPADIAEPPVLLDENQHTYPATSRSAIVLIEQTVGQGGNPQ